MAGITKGRGRGWSREAAISIWNYGRWGFEIGVPNKIANSKNS